MYRCVLAWRVAMAVLLAGAGLHGTALAAASLVAAPAELVLCAGRERLVRVTLVEGRFKRQPSLQAASDSAIQVRPEPVAASTAGSATWLVRVLAPGDGAPPVPGTLHLTAVGEGGAPLSVAVALKTPDPSAAFPARLDLHGAAESLPERISLRLHAVLSNTSSAPLRLESLRAVDGGRPFEVTAVDGSGAAAVVPPGGTRVVPFDVRVGGTTPAAGKHRLLFQADLSGDIDGCPRRASLVASRDLGFQVIGESAALTALAIPSFLLVPGALCLLVPAVLWRFGLRLPGHEKDERFPLGPGTPEFWTLAVTLSIVGFALLTGLGVPADLLVAYRLGDVVLVWLGSVAVGLAWYGPTRWVLLRQRAQRDAAERALQARRQWTASEAPMAFLQRLAERGASLEQDLQPLELQKLGLGTGASALFELELDAQRAWLCPFIEIDAQAASAGVQDAIDSARNTLDPAQLLQVLQADGAQAVQLRWAPSGAWPAAVDLVRYQAARDAARSGRREPQSMVRGV